MDAYVQWRNECAGVWRAYRRWDSAEADDAGATFSTYHAALEREEQAAHVYGQLLSRVLTGPPTPP